MYLGRTEEQFDNYGDPIVTNFLKKCLVNRFFAFPEDWDEDDIPTIMIFAQCRACGQIEQYYLKENKLNIIYNWDEFEYYYVEGAENFLYNGNNTYASFSEEFECRECGKSWNYYQEKVSDPAISAIKEANPHLAFDSKLEILFWKTWSEKSDLPLAIQHQIGKYRVDFAHLPTKTAIEIDGRAYHSTPKQLSDDRQRQIEIEQKGWLFLRFSEHKLVFSTEICVLETLHFLRGAKQHFEEGEIQ